MVDGEGELHVNLQESRITDMMLLAEKYSLEISPYFFFFFSSPLIVISRTRVPFFCLIYKLLGHSAAAVFLSVPC